MFDNDEIIDWHIFRLACPGGKYQYSLVVKFSDGRKQMRRLKGVFTSPGITSFDAENPEIKKHAITVALNQVREEYGTVQTGSYKPRRTMTCRQAMEEYEQWHNENRRCGARAFRYHCNHFYGFFGDNPISYITQDSARKFMESLIEKGYGYDTARLALSAAGGMVRYHKNNKAWDGDNPFDGLFSRYVHKFPPTEPENPRISDAEWSDIRQTVSRPEYRTARIFIEVSLSTGLRPSEVYRLNAEHIDRQQLSWQLMVTKKAGRPMFRRIAIPQSLLTFLDNEGVLGKLPITEITVSRQLRKIREITGIDLVAKRFRKDFAIRMEEAGASEGIINVHQWRGQSGVLYKNYIKFPNRAVTLCRPYIDIMSGEKRKLVVVGNDK